MGASRQSASVDFGITMRVHERAVIASDGFRYARTEQFFFLYLLLAWQRRLPNAPDEGYVGCDLIRRLPYWEKNSLASVGKQIRRHVVQLERQARNVIDYRQRIKGPFRLAIRPDAIRFDVTPGEVRRLLDLPLLQGPGRPEDAPALYCFVQAMCQGNAAFDAGVLDQARIAYEEALAAARTPEQEVATLQKVGRTLERQAQYDRARVCYLKALRLQDQHPELDDSITARTHLFLGWLDYRQGRSARARGHYYRALDLARGKRDDWLLGNLYNGLGLLQKREDEYPDALALFRTALDYWCRADYAYGMAAVYANIGTVYKRWGDHLRDHGFRTEARTRYRQAVEWLTRCTEFSASARLGQDTSEAECMLAEAYLELGDLDRAWVMAQAAREIAQKAGNQVDLAEATFTLGKLSALKGDKEDAERYLRDATTRFEQLGHMDRAADARLRLNALAGQMVLRRSGRGGSR